MDSNIALIERLYAAFRRGEVTPVVESLSPAVTWGVVGQRQHHPDFGIVEGAEAVRAFFESADQNRQITRFEPREMHACGDKVFVLGHYEMTMRATGRPVSTDFVHVFTVRDGKVEAYREFLDTASVVEALRT